ncbi:hypothetical protein [Sneathiella limimaris]|uniref:hypothetical protein n=1 Tax=Sneathiella limimaris TaxID=1964213 RepID=UPI00146DFFA7|nr:hypothetical protein [Sneathiella limimaris]
MNSATINLENAKKKQSDVVQHHEIGELSHFLSRFGKSKEEAVKTLLTSSLQILGLDEIREKFQDRWDTLEKRLDFAVEAFFTKKLSKKDLFLRLGTGNYALIFANTTPEAGSRRASKLADELLTLLFGELPEIEEISIKTMQLDMDLTDFIGELNNFEELIEYLQGYNDEDREVIEQEFKEVEDEISICYRPMVNHVKKLMSVMEALPCRLINRKWVPLSDTDPLVEESPEMRAELDFKVLRDTDEAFKRFAVMPKKPLVMVSVDYETLAHAYRRMKYADILKKLPSFTQRYLIINIENVPAGMLNSRLRQILTTLNPLVLGFTLQVGEHWNDFHVISDLPVYGLSVVGHSEKDLLWIEDLVSRAKGKGVRSCWRDVGSDVLARRAFTVGIDYVSGPVIGALQIDPISPFSLRRAY